MTDSWDDAVLDCWGRSATFVRRLVVVAPQQPMAYDPADWRDAIVIVDRGRLEVECMGGTRQHFGPGAVMCLEDVPLREIRSAGEEPALLVAISRRPPTTNPAMARQRRSVRAMTGPTLEGTHWMVTTLSGAPVDTHAPNSVRFGAGRIVGQVGVNRFSATFQLVDGRIVVGTIMSTMMAGPPEHMRLEAAFHGSLEGDHHFRRDGRHVCIGDDDAGITLRQLDAEPARP